MYELKNEIPLEGMFGRLLNEDHAVGERSDMLCATEGCDGHPVVYSFPNGDYWSVGVCNACLERQDREKEEREAAQRHLDRTRHRISISGLPERIVHWLRTNGDEVMASARQLVRAHMLGDANEGRGLYLVGPVGSGKSTLATALGVTLCSMNGRSDLGRMVFLREHDLFSGVDGREWSDRSKWVEDIKAAPVLILDDLGVVQVRGKAATEALRGIIDYRHSRLLPTIWSSNDSPMRLFSDGLIEQRDLRRITESSHVHTVQHRVAA